MRLLTHNSLRNPAKNVTNGYPLMLEIEDMEIVESECNTDFIRHILPNLQWEGVCLVASAVGLQGIPPTLDNKYFSDESFLKAMHNLLLDVHIIKGKLICPESGRYFPIENGIPNFIMDESEV
eukprot:gene10173-13687_t